MKGIIRGASQVSLSGSVTARVSNGYNDGLIHSRLRRLYPEANQRVFSGIVTTLADKNAQRLSDYDFKQAVKKALLGVVKLAYPDGNYNENTDYGILYLALRSFIEDRDNKIGHYRVGK